MLPAGHNDAGKRLVKISDRRDISQSQACHCAGGLTDENMCMEKPVGETMEEKGEQQSAELTSVELGRRVLLFKYANNGSLLPLFWRLTDKCHPFVFRDLNVLRFCTKQQFYSILTCPHTAAHEPDLIQYKFLPLHVSAELALFTTWANWVAWWKWSWDWCQLVWQGTWDVLVLEGEKTGLRLTDSTVQMGGQHLLFPILSLP